MRNQTFRLICTVSCLFFAALLTAQSTIPSEAQSTVHSWETYFDALVAGDEENASSWQDTYDQLCELEEHPLDVNTIQREELERFPFLTAEQIADICEYVDRYGPLRSMGELMMVESLDVARRQLLQCFLYIGEGKSTSFPSLHTIAKYGKNEWAGSVKIPFYKRKGDDTKYLGYRYKHWMRYQFTYGDYVKMGLLGAQDAGEPFGGHNPKGYDFYSFYVQVRHLGVLQQLNLGRYRASFGMGLVMSTDFSFGKTALLSNMGRSLNHVTAHSSRSSANYLQGAAATVQLFRGFTLTTLGSYRSLDATLNDDGTVSTIVTDGYHRTLKELEKKNNTTQTLGGVHANYFTNGFHVGFTGVYLHYNRRLAPDVSTLYRRYYPIGSDFANFSMDYGLTRSRYSFQGETAINRQGALATIHTANMRLASTLSVLFLHRFYSYRYTALLGNSFSDGGQVCNESGVYAGVQWAPARVFQLAVYGDYASHPWAKYRVSKPSSSFDTQATITSQWQRVLMTLRYRLRLREYDNETKTALIRHRQQQLRWTITPTDVRHWTGTLQLHGTLTDYKQRDWGYMANGELGYLPTDALKLYGQINYFHTTGYESRIYSYERDLLYSMSIPSFYDEGIRYALLARMTFWKRWTVQAKWGVTNYFHRTTIGSGDQQINASAMSDLALLVKCKF